jgi:hypothetical protein
VDTKELKIPKFEQNLIDWRSSFSYNISVASAGKRFCRMEAKGTSQQGGRVMWRMLSRLPPPYFAYKSSILNELLQNPLTNRIYLPLPLLV